MSIRNIYHQFRPPDGNFLRSEHGSAQEANPGDRPSAFAANRQSLLETTVKSDE
jgi:hypothetical protein